MGGTCRLTTGTRGGRGHHSNRPCVVRPITITRVLFGLNVSGRYVITTLLRSIIRSASCGLSCVGRRFNSSITLLISNIAGLNGVPLSAERRIRTRGVHGVFVTVGGSIQIVVVGLTSELRGVHALRFVPSCGRHRGDLRALRVCTPVTRHLNVHTVGSRLRSLTIHCLSPVTCGRVRGSLSVGGRRNRGFLKGVAGRLSREVDPVVGGGVSSEIGSIRNVFHGICVGNGSFRRVCSVCTIHVVISAVVSYCGILNVIRSVCGPVPNEFGSCVSAPGPGVCRSLRAAILSGRKVPFRVRVHA